MFYVDQWVRYFGTEYRITAVSPCGEFANIVNDFETEFEVETYNLE